MLYVLGLIVVIAVWLWATYNGLVKSNIRVDEAWSDITVQLKRRFDLIPNLVNTVKGYAKHERELFENVTKARTAVMSAAEAGDIKGTAQAENSFAGVMKSLFAVAENYPDLKANENFKHLQEELVDTENKVQASRRFYNGAARDLNTKIKMFPAILIAQMLGFKVREFFEVENQVEVEQAPDVNF
jgi:LemA protein